MPQLPLIPLYLSPFALAAWLGDHVWWPVAALAGFALCAVVAWCRRDGAEVARV